MCHRERIYAISQRLLKFGQTWRFTNATHIVPGFASMYRTDVLPQIEMNPPGLVIEDFNMTFEIYQKRLGKVAFSLGAVAVTQDPDNLRDYVRQIKRWGLGLWQTVRRHPPRSEPVQRHAHGAAPRAADQQHVLPAAAVAGSRARSTRGVPGRAVVAPDSVAAQRGRRAHDPAVLLLAVTGADLALTCVVALIERRLRFLLSGSSSRFCGCSTPRSRCTCSPGLG